MQAVSLGIVWYRGEHACRLIKAEVNDVQVRLCDVLRVDGGGLQLSCIQRSLVIDYL